MPTSQQPYRVTFVCSGNICRSPIAEVVLREHATRADLGDVVRFDSAGTGGWHVGQPADPRAVAALTAAGYPAGEHRARQLDPQDYPGTDLLVALDGGHEQAMLGWAPDGEQRRTVRLLRSFDPAADGPDVADPYYGGDDGFATVLAQVEAAAPGLLEHVRRSVG